MGAIPEVVVDDRVVLAGISLAFVDGLTAIDAVVQEPIVLIVTEN
jgi:hypothetical protein